MGMRIANSFALLTFYLPNSLSDICVNTNRIWKCFLAEDKLDRQRLRYVVGDNLLCDVK